jgi:Periplasmic binding protein
VASPRIPDATLARYPGASGPPRPHTAAELARLLSMLHADGAATIAIGHGRHPASVAAAHALAAAWAAGPVLAVVSWPATAASWLRPARRLAAARPDAWIIADTPAGCAQLARRLAGQPGWAPDRTFGFADLGRPDLVALAGPALAGMSGPTASGGTWRITGHLLVRDESPQAGAP